jgi:NAD-dependent dihydropyrimidine dehydrogenase PreA subunit
MEMRYLKNVSTLRLNADRCTGCGMCIEVCPHTVFQIEDKKTRIVDRDLCMECGACSKNCPAGALFVRAGVGCATAVIQGKLKGTGPTCGCSVD